MSMTATNLAPISAPILRLPYSPRWYQRAIHQSDKRFQVVVAHRRAGKTVALVNHCIRGVLRCEHERPQLAYIAPTYRMAHRIAWDYVKQYSEPIPGCRPNASELHMIYPNGGKLMLLGADRMHDLRGMYLMGVVLDEYALMHPRLFTEIILPALMDYQGWAILAGTPLGANQLKRAYEAAQAGAPDWQAHMLRASQTQAIAPGDLAIARANMSPEEYEQEFECSFAAVIKGAIYAREIAAAEREGRICDVPYDPMLPVTVAVDLGMRDAFALWFLQEHRVGGQVRAIDYREYTGKGLPQIKREVDQLGYTITRWCAPHDIAVRELGTGRSRQEVARGLGMNFEPGVQMSLADGIEATRSVLPLMVFDRKRCEFGLDCLRQYRYVYDEQLQIMSKDPEHDWTSHCADGLRTYATSRSAATRSDWSRSLRDTELATRQRASGARGVAGRR
jgi:phage terminase large subunit